MAVRTLTGGSASTPAGRLEVVEATAELLAAYHRSPAQLGLALGGVRVPRQGYPEFAEAFSYVAEVLTCEPQQAGWWMSFFIDRAAGALIGSGGFNGPPESGAVEIGYEVAPEFRRRGYASEITVLLAERAFASSEVDLVVAHTAAEDAPSARIIARYGFLLAGTVMDPDDGEVWQWRLARPVSG